MIDENLIAMAIGDTIASSPFFPRISWANKDSDLDRPYLSLSLVPFGIADETVGQTAPIWTGFMQASIVTGLDEYDREGIDLRQILASLFPSGERFQLADGTRVMVSRHPQPKPGYRDGPDYRLPLQIHLSSDTY